MTSSLPILDDQECPCCFASGLVKFYEIRDMPAHSVLLLPSREAALEYPKGNITLAYCPRCGFITNTAFDNTLHEYSEKYEETQGFSDTFSTFHDRLARDLIDRYGLRKKRILEIGCGKGEFLALLCTIGDNQGVGFDPAYVPGRVPEDPRLKFVEDFYSETYRDVEADFICCKMTLEHIQNPFEFVSIVRKAIGQRTETVVFFQVPDSARVLSEIAFWDIYYEHCSYFSLGSLARLFRRCGFEVCGLSRGYGDQYAMIEARPSGTSAGPLENEDDLSEMRTLVDRFAREQGGKVQHWRDLVQHEHRKGRRTVIWGAGSKGVSFLCTLRVGPEIEFAVDINPFKRGTHMAGTGQEIVEPSFLREYRPDVVLAMNPIYCEEIRRDLARLNVSAEVRAV